MPFSAAHPAAVLPLRRFCPGVFVWSALLIGSLTPDLECFLELRPVARHGLTFAGSLYFCLPAGLVLYFLWHSVIKRPATLLLPDTWRAVVWPVVERPMVMELSSLGAVVISILVGTWLHQAWDSFTHSNSLGVLTVPLLSTSLATFDGYDLTIFRLLQHVSSVVGMTLLTVAAIRWKKRATPGPAPALSESVRIAAISLIVFAPGLLGALRAISHAAPYDGVSYAKQFAAFGIITAISLGALVLLFVAATVHLFRGRLVEEP
jgi:hypothetical protein